MHETAARRVRRLIEHVYGPQGVNRASKAIGLHQRTLASIAPKGDAEPAEPKLETAQKIADFFDVPLDWLARGRGPEPAVFSLTGDELEGWRAWRELATKRVPSVTPLRWLRGTTPGEPSLWDTLFALPLTQVEQLGLFLSLHNAAPGAASLISRSASIGQPTAEQHARVLEIMNEASARQGAAWGRMIADLTELYGAERVARAIRECGAEAWLGFNTFAAHLSRTNALPNDLAERFGSWVVKQAESAASERAASE